jgi:hypothetical protein
LQLRLIRQRRILLRDFSCDSPECLCLQLAAGLLCQSVYANYPTPVATTLRNMMKNWFHCFEAKYGD